MKNINKQLLLILLILVFFSYTNYSFCDSNPSVFEKINSNTIKYIDNLTFEKTLQDSFSVFSNISLYSTYTLGTILGVGCVLQGMEYVWNARLLGSKVLYNFTPLGHLDDFSGKTTSWLGFRNTSGPLKETIETISYEEFWLLNKGKTYLLPAFIQKKINQEQSVINTPKNVERFVDHTVHQDKTIYIPTYIYKDRENLTKITQEINYLKEVAQDANLIQRSIYYGREGIAQELGNLHKYNDILFLKENTINNTFFLKHIEFEYNPHNEEIKFDFIFNSLTNLNNKDIRKKINFLEWKQKYPILAEIFNAYSDLDLIKNSEIEGAMERPSGVYLDIKYKKKNPSSYLNINEVDSYFCSFYALTINPNIAVDVGVDIMLQRGETISEHINRLIFSLENKLEDEYRLINLEKKTISTQTSTNNLNETLFTHINEFLEVRDKTSVSIATNEGHKILFNKLSSKTIIDNQLSINIQKEENSTQTENCENTETVDLSNTVSTIVQNPSLMFAATLGILISDNLQTIEIAAQTLLGFTHISEFNDAFIAATHLSVLELQNTYNLTHEVADRAEQILWYAYDTKYPETSSDISSILSEDTNNYNNTFSWNRVFIVGITLIALTGTSYFLYQSIKNGAPVEQTVQNVTQNVEIWKNT